MTNADFNTILCQRILALRKQYNLTLEKMTYQAKVV